jgi:pimeloyl-ACP methyl ester carboxylesterase
VIVPTLKANGLNFQVNRFRSGPVGERPVAVAIHGLGVVDGASMAMTVGMPLAKYFDVIVYDLRGHGRSELVKSGFSVANHVTDLLAILDALEVDEAVHLVPGSYGGAVAVALAVQHPERVRSLAMIDPMLPLPDWGENLALWMGYFAEQLAEGKTVDDMMEFLGTTARRRSTALFERGRKLLFETTLLDDCRAEQGLTMDDYARITCPVLGAFGTDSEISFMWLLLKNLIPHAEILEVSGADHIQIFGRPETRAGLVSFIKRVEDERALSPVPVSTNAIPEP